MTEGRGNGYVVLPVVLLTGSFLLPLFARLGEWLNLPGGPRLAIPMLLLVGALAGVGTLLRGSDKGSLPGEPAPGADVPEARKDVV